MRLQTITARNREKTPEFSPRNPGEIPDIFGKFPEISGTSGNSRKSSPEHRPFLGGLQAITAWNLEKTPEFSPRNPGEIPEIPEIPENPEITEILWR